MKRQISYLLLSALFIAQASFASTETVQEQEPNYRYVTKPTESFFIQRTPSIDKLISNVTAGLIQGVDSNPLLDSSHEVDSYTQETLDMHYKYPVFGSVLGFTNSKFGFNVTNMNYYKATDVNIFDAIGDVNLEQEIFDKVTLNAGYVFEYMWFPNSRDGTFVGNQLNIGMRQDLTDWAYQKAAYRIILRGYQYRKAELGDGTNSAHNRFDVRNQFEHELGVYAGKKTKIRITNQLYINKSNDQYFDYYDYLNYRFGTSLVQSITGKLYGMAGFYYQRRNYLSRQVSDGAAIEKDNLYLATASVMYDITKDISLFVNYSHSENHTNNPIEEYVDTIYSGGFYYSF
ncbi:MAG: hypothetical protein Q7S07_05160 [Candidatus Omnitrophota bacterium]|nr:hypothetical protein [Candidatus Omnitrophota bacterium]